MLRAEVIDEGTLTCFEPGLTYDDGSPVNVEVSAAVFDGERLILASDKPIPGESRSAAFAVALENGKPVPESLTFLTAAAIKRAIKYEDFALTADGSHILATTGFDRIDGESHDLNAYNHLLIWPIGEPDRVQVVDPDPRDGVEGSLELRRKLDEAIGLPYYKIEGLAAVPSQPDLATPSDGLLLFGVREQGQDHENFEYVCRVVGAHYRVTDSGNLTFVDKLEERYRFSPGNYDGVRHVCGLSSLEYDPFNERLYLMASFEVDTNHGEQIGGYLWSMPLADFHADQVPSIVENAHGDALEFEHKAEGLAVLDATRVFVAYDNDRDMSLGSIDERDRRDACEAPYTLMRLTPRP
ncbi:hypothetical protein [Salinicola rhizosphaerae]|uniref:DUF3616 domain-containing protein n=1 Tax=Salinicola rhizosphaerae TaxID=1443141 RepID=A0ABQ3EJ50_9GAMM|nr:hypothetical protein [Salinicola rhizosphaerae]GHB32396.1 hypothetical protein GCM10009038_34000 [Salinicola rhizosphaerae]